MALDSQDLLASAILLLGQFVTGEVSPIVQRVSQKRMLNHIHVTLELVKVFALLGDLLLQRSQPATRDWLVTAISCWLSRVGGHSLLQLLLTDVDGLLCGFALGEGVTNHRQ